MNKAIKNLCEKPQDVKMGRIEVIPAISFISDVSHYGSSNDKSKFIKLICRYNTANEDIDANTYQGN